ncbi:MAG: hypothetical protein ACHQ16_00205 [Candidatus Lutacidiplasmatales archaeon]
MVWTWLLGVLKGLGERLLRPKDQRPLDDHSNRQTNVFSKVENNIFIVHLPDKNESLIGDFDHLPKPVLDAIKKQFESGAPRIEQPVKIRLLRDDFSDEVNDFQAYLAREDSLLKTIEPYLEPQYASILRLAAYAKNCYDRNRRSRGDEVRNQIGLQYGRAGRKLCNLYLKGYVSDMFVHYLKPALTSGGDPDGIRKEINELLRSLIRFSENVHFIHQGLPDGVVVDSVSEAAKNQAPYIAIHAAGPKNVRKVERVIRELDLTFLRENGYAVEQTLSNYSPEIPILDIYMRLAPGAAKGESVDSR